MPMTSIAMPSQTRVEPKVFVSLARSIRTFDDLSFEKNWKIVNPKLISESDVRITDMSVRSALMRVRWNDMPVRRADSSVDGSSNGCSYGPWGARSSTVRVPSSCGAACVIGDQQSRPVQPQVTWDGRCRNTVPLGTVFRPEGDTVRK